MAKKLVLLVIFVGVIFAVSAEARKKKNDAPVSVDVTNIKTAVENHGTSLANLTNQVNEVVSQFNLVRGDAGRNFKKNKEQDKVLRDSQTRMQVLEDQVDLLTTQLAELQKEGLLSKTASQRFKEYKEYAKGLQHINSKEFEKAIKEFQDFRKNNKKSIFNNYAQYWIGEAYYMQADYPMAIKQYQKLLSKTSKSAKSPTALYRQGLSFYQLQSFDDAKAFFTKVIRSYPSSIEAIQSSAQIKRINNIQSLKEQQELEMKMIQ